jgi:hypothetical protein
VSPTNYGSLSVDTAFRTNVNTPYVNATQNAYGTQGNGYTYQVPQNGLLMTCNAQSTNTTSMGYRYNYNAYGSNGNYGLYKPTMNMSSKNNCSFSC